jgi:hypothetical protein
MSSGDIRQFRAVVISGAAVVEVDTEDTNIDGIAQMPAVDGTPEVIRIMQSGISFAIAGDTVVAGDDLITDSQGRLVPGDYADFNIVGKALSAGAVGEEIAVLLK